MSRRNQRAVLAKLQKMLSPESSKPADKEPQKLAPSKPRWPRLGRLSAGVDDAK